MSDMNRDGKVSLEEYEQLILRSLEKAGMKIDVHTQSLVNK